MLNRNLTAGPQDHLLPNPTEIPVDDVLMASLQKKYDFENIIKILKNIVWKILLMKGIYLLDLVQFFMVLMCPNQLKIQKMTSIWVDGGLEFIQQSLIIIKTNILVNLPLNN